MPGCCEPGDFDNVFGASRARADARGYERRGLGTPSRWLFDALRDRATGRSVLEIGGGVGALQIELLRAGASSAINVELSRGYEDAARDLASRAAVSERIDRRIADFVAKQDTVTPADLVILDRVVCCYPDAPALVGAAARHAREALALTLPRETWWMRVGRAAINLWPRLSGSRFRFFVHRTATVVAAAEGAGMRVSARRHGLVWQMLVFAR